MMIVSKLYSSHSKCVKGCKNSREYHSTGSKTEKRVSQGIIQESKVISSQTAQKSKGWITTTESHDFTKPREMQKN